MTPELKGRRVLVTGGTGFIGGRVVEKLVLEAGARVRVMTSSMSHAARVSRFDLELVRGDVADSAAVRAAADGCDVIVHCAYGARGSDAERRRVTVAGTRAVLDAGLAVRARRIVHLSTMVVYGIGIEGRLDETMPRRRSGVAYADSKLEAEELALSYARQRAAPVTVIQPAAVYGPYAPAWTVRVLASLRTGRVVLIDGGSGYANPVYVDDVADAVLLAATRDAAVGEAFLVSGGERVTWRTFNERFEEMLGTRATVSMGQEEARAHYARSQRRPSVLRELAALTLLDRTARARIAHSREVRALMPVLRPLATSALGSRLLGRTRRGARGSSLRSEGGGTERPDRLDDSADSRRIHPVHPRQITFLAARTEVSIDKAQRLLGYEPQFAFARGSDLTEQWARWANLVGDS